MSYIDVRSPGEFAHAHIPGARNLPLFTDAERAEVGTLYKQSSPEEAFARGLHFVGPKMEQLVAQARTFGAPLTLYCARGGMRSQSVCWLLAQAGLEVSALPGGYKTYRQKVLSQLEKRYTLQVLTGLTGCGKTERLHQLRDAGEQVLDLEALAQHKGSVFGFSGVQPSNEMFENRIAAALQGFTPERPTWVEDESRLIGTCKIPDALYAQMQEASLHEVKCSETERKERLMREYGSLAPAELIAATRKLERRLGGERTRETIEAIERGDPEAALARLLDYYDRCYATSLQKKLKR